MMDPSSTSKLEEGFEALSSRFGKPSGLRGEAGAVTSTAQRGDAIEVNEISRSNNRTKYVISDDDSVAAHGNVREDALGHEQEVVNSHAPDLAAFEAHFSETIARAKAQAEETAQEAEEALSEAQEKANKSKVWEKVVEKATDAEAAYDNLAQFCMQYRDHLSEYYTGWMFDSKRMQYDLDLKRAEKKRKYWASVTETQNFKTEGVVGASAQPGPSINPQAPNHGENGIVVPNFERSSSYMTRFANFEDSFSQRIEIAKAQAEEITTIASTARIKAERTGTSEQLWAEAAEQAEKTEQAYNELLGVYKNYKEQVEGYHPGYLVNAKRVCYDADYKKAETGKNASNVQAKACRQQKGELQKVALGKLQEEKAQKVILDKRLQYAKEAYEQGAKASAEGRRSLSKIWNNAGDLIKQKALAPISALKLAREKETALEESGQRTQAKLSFDQVKREWAPVSRAIKAYLANPDAKIDTVYNAGVGALTVGKTFHQLKGPDGKSNETTNIGAMNIDDMSAITRAFIRDEVTAVALLGAACGSVIPYITAIYHPGYSDSSYNTRIFCSVSDSPTVTIIDSLGYMCNYTEPISSLQCSNSHMQVYSCYDDDIYYACTFVKLGHYFSCDSGVWWAGELPFSCSAPPSNICMPQNQCGSCSRLHFNHKYNREIIIVDWIISPICYTVIPPLIAFCTTHSTTGDLFRACTRGAARIASQARERSARAGAAMYETTIACASPIYQTVSACATPLAPIYDTLSVPLRGVVNTTCIAGQSLLGCCTRVAPRIAPEEAIDSMRDSVRSVGTSACAAGIYEAALATLSPIVATYGALNAPLLGAVSAVSVALAADQSAWVTPFVAVGGFVAGSIMAPYIGAYTAGDFLGFSKKTHSATEAALAVFRAHNNSFFNGSRNIPSGANAIATTDAAAQATIAAAQAVGTDWEEETQWAAQTAQEIAEFNQAVAKRK